PGIPSGEHNKVFLDLLPIRTRLIGGVFHQILSPPASIPSFLLIHPGKFQCSEPYPKTCVEEYRHWQTVELPGRWFGLTSDRRRNWDPQTSSDGRRNRIGNDIRHRHLLRHIRY